MSISKPSNPAGGSAHSERYLFETSFDSDRTAIAGPQEAAVEPAIAITDLQQAREQAFAEGEAAGRQGAVDSIEKQLLNGLARLVEQMGALSKDQARFQNGLTERSVELALKATRKMLPALAQSGGLVEIEALLADCLREARAEPRIVLRVADDVVEPLAGRIDALAAKAGYEGTVKLLADDTLGPADCRVEWADGGAERIAERMWQEFEAATHRIFRNGDGDGDDTAIAPAEEPPVPGADADPEAAAAAHPNGHANGHAHEMPAVIGEPTDEPTDAPTDEPTDEPTESSDLSTGQDATTKADPPQDPAAASEELT